MKSNTLHYVVLAIAYLGFNLSFGQNLDNSKIQFPNNPLSTNFKKNLNLIAYEQAIKPAQPIELTSGPKKYNLTYEKNKILSNRIYRGTNSSGGGSEIEVMYRSRAIQIFTYLLSLDVETRNELAFSSWELLSMINNNDIFISCAGKEEQEVLEALNKRAYVFEESNNIIWLDCKTYDSQSWKDFLANKKYFKNSTKRDFVSEINDSISIIHEVLRASNNRDENNYRLSGTYSKAIEKTLAYQLADFADDIIEVSKTNAVFIAPQFKYIDQQYKLGSMQNTKKYDYADKYCLHVGFDYAEKKSIIFNYNPSDLNYLEFDEAGSLRGVKIGRPGWLYQYQQINCLKN